jgi:hypothetical protein
MLRDKCGIAEQVEDRIRRALDLKHLTIRNPAEGTDNRIARARDDVGIRIERPQARLELARETVMQAFEIRLARF